MPLLSCYGNLLYVKPVKERLAIYYSLLKTSLLSSYGQHDIKWGLPTALHVTMMNVKHKLARITEMQDNISPITVERVRPTTAISRQEKKIQIVLMASYVHLLNDRDDTVFGLSFGGNNEWHFFRKYNISQLPVIPINGSHITDTKVTPPDSRGWAITTSQGDTSFIWP
jgi:hypothetical protein